MKVTKRRPFKELGAGQEVTEERVHTLEISMGTFGKALKKIKTEIKQLVDNGNKQQSKEIEDILEKQKVNNEIINRNVKKGNGCV